VAGTKYNAEEIKYALCGWLRGGKMVVGGKRERM
jgi:hypothetical protein